MPAAHNPFLSALIKRFAFIAFCIVAVGPGYAQTADDSNGVISADDQSRILFLANGLYQTRVQGPEAIVTLSILQAAEAAHVAGAALNSQVEALKTAVAQERKRWTALGMDIGLDTVEEHRRIIRAVLRADAFRAGAARELLQKQLATLNPPELSAAARDVASLRLEGLQRVQTDVLSSAHSLYKASSKEYREAFDRSVQPLIKATPKDAADAILKANPEFANQPQVKAVVRILKSATGPNGKAVVSQAVIEDLTQLGKGSVQQALDVVKDGTGFLRAQELAAGSVENYLFDRLSSAAGFDTRRAVAAARSLQDGLTLANAESGIFLAETIIGFKDRKAARDFGRIARSGVQIAQLVSAYSSGASVGGAAASVGAGAMTGGVFNAVVALSAMSGGAGSGDASQEMLSMISEQIETVRQEMHSRFDAVDAKLNEIHRQMIEEFHAVRKQLERMEGDLSAVRASLVAIGRQLSEVETRLLAALGDLHSEIRQGDLSTCANWLEHTSVVEMSDESYVNCMILLHGWATRRAALASDVGAPTDLRTDSALAELSKPPFSNIAFWLDAAAQLNAPIVAGDELRRAAGDPGVPTITAPRTWIAAAIAYARLARAFPDQYAKINLKRLEDIGEAGSSTLDRLGRLRSATYGERLFSAVLKELDAAHAGFIASLSASRTKLLGDVKAWSEPDARASQDRIQMCSSREPKDSYLYPTNHPYREVSLPSASSLGAPPQLRKAEELGLGKAVACVVKISATDFKRVCRLSMSGGFCLEYGRDPVNPSKVEVAIEASFLFNDGRLVKAARYELTTANPVQLPPQPGYCGGVAGCSREHFFPYYKGMAALLGNLWNSGMKKAWEDGTFTLAEPETEVLVEVGQAAADTSAEVRSKLADQTYALMLDKPDSNEAKVVRRLSNASLLARGFTALGFEGEVESSDILKAVVAGDSPIINRQELDLLRARSIEPWRLEKLASGRLAAFKNELQAARNVAQGKPPPALASAVTQVSFEGFEPSAAMMRNHLRHTLDDLKSLYAEQRLRCQKGERPNSTCGSDGRFP